MLYFLINRVYHILAYIHVGKGFLLLRQMAYLFCWTKEIHYMVIWHKNWKWLMINDKSWHVIPKTFPRPYTLIKYYLNVHVQLSVPDPCENNPCGNGGTCMQEPGSCSGFSCVCTECFTGPSCAAGNVWKTFYLFIALFIYSLLLLWWRFYAREVI